MIGTQIFLLREGALVPVAGNGEPFIQDGPASSASFFHISSMEAGADGRIYVVDASRTLRLFHRGEVRTLSVD